MAIKQFCDEIVKPQNQKKKKVVKYRNVEAVKIIQPTIGEQQEKGNWVSNPINLFRDAFNWVQLGLLRAKIKTF